MMQIKEIPHSTLTLPDGTALAFRVWMPIDAEIHPVPAILEFLPYRKSDGTIVRDEITMSQTAKQGYACIRVDLRGCGESRGLFEDEYSAQELQDGYDTIAWLAKQSWCNGNVGMVGISWGGFNALQIAAKKPPALKAIITQCSTDDRYRDDIHYQGGCLLNDNMDWAAFFWAYAQARCPDPLLFGNNWEKEWLHRLDNMPLLIDKWLKEQNRSQYWQHGSICEDYSAISIPVYAMSGWADAYRNTVFTLLKNLKGPKKGIVGPWAHKYPNIAYPAPQMDYVKESVRWWDRWLKEIENGIDLEPELNYYLQDSVLPKRDYESRPGTWLYEEHWPSSNIIENSWYLQDKRITLTPSEQTEMLTISSPQTIGLEGGRFCVGIRQDMENPGDQRPDDAGSLIFDTPPLSDDLPIVGQIKTNLTLSSDKEKANIIVRVSEVHPCGKVTCFSHGMLNLTHHQSHEEPSLLQPEDSYPVIIPVKHIAYKIPKGHRLRVSISTNYWPLIWPAPENATVKLYLKECYITVPTLNEEKYSSYVPNYCHPVTFNGGQLSPALSERTVTKDYKTNRTILETYDDFGQNYYHSSGSDIGFDIHQIFSINENEPLTASNKLILNVEMGRSDWRTALKAQYHMTCDNDYLYLKVNWNASLNDKEIFNRTFNEKIERIYI